MTNPINAWPFSLAESHLQLAIGRAYSESLLPGPVVFPSPPPEYHPVFPDIVDPGLLIDDLSWGSIQNLSEMTRKAIDISEPSLHPATPLLSLDSNDTSDLHPSGQEVVGNCFDDLLQVSHGPFNPIFHTGAGDGV